MVVGQAVQVDSGLAQVVDRLIFGIHKKPARKRGYLLNWIT